MRGFLTTKKEKNVQFLFLIYPYPTPKFWKNMLPISENSTFERKNACWQNNKSRLIVTEKWYNLREYDANYGTVRGWKFNERLATWNFSHKFSLTLLPLTYFTVFSAQYFVLIRLVLAKKTEVDHDCTNPTPTTE